MSLRADQGSSGWGGGSSSSCSTRTGASSTTKGGGQGGAGATPSSTARAAESPRIAASVWYLLCLCISAFSPSRNGELLSGQPPLAKAKGRPSRRIILETEPLRRSQPVRALPLFHAGGVFPRSLSQTFSQASHYRISAASGVAGGSGGLASGNRIWLRDSPFRGDYRLPGFRGRITVGCIDTSQRSIPRRTKSGDAHVLSRSKPLELPQVRSPGR